MKTAVPASVLQRSFPNIFPERKAGGIMCKISVLIPICNVEAYLEQCIQSLMNQSFQDFELICVNDGSTDKSASILDRCAAFDGRIKVIHKENTGYGNSMNVALSQAEGEYVAILESDDFAEPDMLRKLYEASAANAADVVKGDYFHYLDGGDTFVNRLDGYPKNRPVNCISCPMILNLADSIWSCLYRRSFLLEHRIRFHETPGASYQDISFALQIWCYAERVYFLEDALLHYRRDNPNASMNNPRKLFCVFEEYEWAEIRLREKLDESSTLLQYFTASKYRDYFNHYHRVGVQYQYALLHRLEQSFLEDSKRGCIRKEAFPERVWKNLQEMREDKNRFFEKTAKPVADMRLNACGFENNALYAGAFLEKLETYPRVFLYGAGQVGKRLADAVLKQGGKVDAFLVTRRSEGSSDCMGIPILALSEAAEWADTCAVVIAVAEWSQYELYTNLEKYGFRHIFRRDAAIKEILA